MNPLEDLGFIIIFFPGYSNTTYFREFLLLVSWATLSPIDKTTICMKHLWHMIHEMVSGWAMCGFVSLKLSEVNPNSPDTIFWRTKNNGGFFLRKMGYKQSKDQHVGACCMGCFHWLCWSKAGYNRCITTVVDSWSKTWEMLECQNIRHHVGEVMSISWTRTFWLNTILMVLSVFFLYFWWDQRVKCEQVQTLYLDTCWIGWDKFCQLPSWRFWQHPSGQGHSDENFMFFFKAFLDVDLDVVIKRQ